jgi:FkbM family methyltransferase
MTTQEAPGLDTGAAPMDPSTRRRIHMTVSCRDSEHLPRVPGAGEVFEHDGVRVQRMFNGVLVEEGSYFGDFNTPIIRGLRGVHEPQEEPVVHEIVGRLVAEREAGIISRRPFAIELGSFWAYYSIWFCQALPDAHVLAMEPDPAFLEVGQRNAGLNHVADRITFVHGAVSDQSGSIPFVAESDGKEYTVPAHDLASLMAIAGADEVDVVFCDIQGFETPMLRQSAALLASGAVRFVVMSTHHSSISGDPLTHQKALNSIEELGGHVIAEHTVSESFSGDGLIVASFNGRDRDIVVDVSHARAKQSLFGELEQEVGQYLALHREEYAIISTLRQDVEGLHEGNAQLRERVVDLTHKLENTSSTATDLDETVAQLSRANADLQARIDQMQATRIWRWSRAPRDMYAHVRRLSQVRLTASPVPHDPE